MLGLAASLGCTNPLDSEFLPTGSYTLITVDGAPLPVRGATATTVRGSLVLASRSSYTLTQTDSAHTGGARTEFRSEGTWSLTDNALVLHEGGNVYLGIVAGSDTVRVNLNTRINTYIRR